MGVESLKTQAMKAIEADPREASEILAELQVRASEAAASVLDHGQLRLLEAHRREVLIERIVSRVAAMHALRTDVVRRPPYAIHKKPHVVMARSNAAWLMKGAGISNADTARALRTCPSQATRYAQRWAKHRSSKIEGKSA